MLARQGLRTVSVGLPGSSGVMSRVVSRTYCVLGAAALASSSREEMRGWESK